MVFGFPSTALVPFGKLLSLASQNSDGLMRGISNSAVDLISLDMKKVGILKDKFGKPTINLSCDETDENYRRYFAPVQIDPVKILNLDDGILDLDGFPVLQLTSRFSNDIQFSDGRHRIFSCDKAFCESVYGTHVLCSITNFKDPADMKLDSYRKSEERPVVYGSIHDALECLNVPLERAINLESLRNKVKSSLGFTKQLHVDRFCKLLLHLFPSSKKLLDTKRDSMIFSEDCIFGSYGRWFVPLMQETGRGHLSCYRYSLSHVLRDLACKQEIQLKSILLCDALSRRLYLSKDRPKVLSKVSQSILDVIKRIECCHIQLRLIHLPYLFSDAVKSIQKDFLRELKKTDFVDALNELFPNNKNGTKHFLSAEKSIFARQNVSGSAETFMPLGSSRKMTETQSGATTSVPPNTSVTHGHAGTSHLLILERERHKTSTPSPKASRSQRFCFTSPVPENPDRSLAIPVAQPDSKAKIAQEKSHLDLERDGNRESAKNAPVILTPPYSSCVMDETSETVSALCTETQNDSETSLLLRRSSQNRQAYVPSGDTAALMRKPRKRKQSEEHTFSARRRSKRLLVKGKKSMEDVRNSSETNSRKVSHTKGTTKSSSYSTRMGFLCPGNEARKECEQVLTLNRRPNGTSAFAKAKCSIKCLSLASDLLSRFSLVGLEKEDGNDSTIRLQRVQSLVRDAILLVDQSFLSCVNTVSVLSEIEEKTCKIGYIMSITEIELDDDSGVFPGMVVVSAGTLRMKPEKANQRSETLFVKVYAPRRSDWNGPATFTDTHDHTKRVPSVLQDFFRSFWARMYTHMNRTTTCVLDCMMDFHEAMDISLEIGFGGYYLKFFSQKEGQADVTTECLLIMKKHIMEHCDCGGHALLTSENEQRLNEYKEPGHGFDSPGNHPFLLGTSADDFFPCGKIFTHSSLSVRNHIPNEVPVLPNEDKVLCTNDKDPKSGLSFRRGAFVSKQTAEQLAKKAVPCDILFPKSILVDSLIPARPNLSYHKSFEMTELFLSGITHRKLWLCFFDTSVACLFNEGGSDGQVSLALRCFDYEYMKQLYEEGFVAMKRKNMSLVCLRLIPSIVQNASTQLHCKNCGAWELSLLDGEKTIPQQ